MSEQPFLSISHRLRSTPFTRRVTQAGVKAYTVYNHTLLPTVFESIEADYHHLKRHVQVWDVACERQVEIAGRDADRLVQFLTPRHLARMQDDQCFYVPMVDHTGGMLNDPVLLRIDEDRYWLSIADSDVLLWAMGIATALKLNVNIHEPDVSPLAVQGPKSDELMARVFGESVRDIRFFRYRKLSFRNRQFVVARSGYSRQGGFEIYVDGSDMGEPMWDALFEAGRDLEVRAGCPNLIERIEGGLLSYGNDMTRCNTPPECGLQKYCNAPEGVEFVGREALARITPANLKRQIRGLIIEGEPVPPCTESWSLASGGKFAGEVSSASWSPDLGYNVALAMVNRDFWEIGTTVSVNIHGRERAACVCSLPFPG
ncbi:MAG: dimethylsulfoniopropionate demethylase [Proteobacteria bacterium]|nr:MAG: dimethylsulfoniopropionate demethylase [Pseudomonadota bacterium]